MNLPHGSNGKILGAELMQKQTSILLTRSRRSESVNPRLSPAQGGWLNPPRRVLNPCSNPGISPSATDSSQQTPPRDIALKICLSNL